MNRQKSDHLIVVLKRVKARGAKWVTSQRNSLNETRTTQEVDEAWNKS